VPELGELKKKEAEGDNIDPSYAFLKGVELNDSFSRIISVDPQIPQELLPDDWIEFKAERICDEYLQFLEGLEEEK